MSDLFYPDRSVFQGRASAAGAVALCARASEGDWLADADYAWNRSAAQAAGAFFFSYHFLESYSAPAAQAAFCHSIVGRTPLMLDFEPITGSVLMEASRGVRPLRGGVPLRPLDMLDGGSYPAVSTALAFVDEFRALGGTCHVVYLPRWYWAELGSPSLQGFLGRGCVLVSSDYTTYSDTGPGWQPYGGMTPLVWQYSDSVSFNGATTDFNAFKGTVAELGAYVTTGKPPAPKPAPGPAPHLHDRTGDTMFTLANGAGAVTPLPVPAAVLQPDGATQVVAPTVVRFASNGPADLEVMLGNTGTWTPFAIDYTRSPTEVQLNGASVLKVQRVDGGTNLVTGDFA